MSSRRMALEFLEASAGTNAGLWLDKCLDNVEAKGPGRQEHFDQLAHISISDEYRRFFQRWKDSVPTLEPFTETAEAVAPGRLIVGLGAESVLETAILLHRTYGVPYISGSALKGLAAAAAHKHLADPRWRKACADRPIGEFHRILFGDQESAGYVIFHDALWVPEGNKVPLDLDVMTVHHPDYYQAKDNAPPADWDSPTPVAFVSARGQFLLALTGPEEWATAAMGILKEALEKDGIGAKTAAGYGRMRVLAKTRPEKTNWEPKVNTLSFSNADDIVPGLLQSLSGDELRRAAIAIVGKLGRQDLRAKHRRDKEWVKLVFALTENNS